MLALVSRRLLLTAWGVAAACGFLYGPARSAVAAERPLPSLGKAGSFDDTQREELRKGLHLEIPGNRFAFRFLRGNLIGDQILEGTWQPPKAGDKLELGNNVTGTWEAIEADADGKFANLRGYLYFEVPSDSDRVAILQATGHSLAYVNGQPHAAGLRLTWQREGTATSMPVELKKGMNHLLFLGGGIGFSAAMVTPSAPAMLDTVDMTLPDFLVGSEEPVWAAMMVINATGAPARELVIEAEAGGKTLRTPVPVIAPAAGRKIGFRIPAPATSEPGEQAVTVALLRKSEDSAEPLDQKSITLGVRGANQSRKQTFLSNIDGSVQYYAIQPATPLPGDDSPKALVLSLHGAGVVAINQANSYASKSWAHLIAPTNRRPYGFNWESIGRLDAMEALADAQKRLGTDPRRTYLTGHSMGGHGVWHVGQTFPDRFAAIGPSAGWVRLGRYRGRGQDLPENPSELDMILFRPSNPNNTEALASNYAQLAVYILHGSDDDNVPVTHARRMNELLSAFHHDLTYFEQPGVGHWWDKSDAAGVDCVDWMPMFQLFAQRTIPANSEVYAVKFVTANPAVSSSCHWASIEDQVHKLDVSTIDLRWYPHLRRFSGTTDNVSRLALDVAHTVPGEPISVVLDEQEIKDIPWPESKRLWFTREDGQWSHAGPAPAERKGPHRYGPLSDLFRNRMMFVYGTAGTPEENAWALAKARYDAEAFWLGGNGSVDIVADSDFDATAERDRNVILYGNAESNAAWAALLAESPVQVRRGAVQIGEKSLEGEDLACAFLRPRPDSAVASAGAIAPTGRAGMRATYRLRYLQPSVDYPDCIVTGPETNDVRGAGFFGSDWSVERGEFAWRE